MCVYTCVCIYIYIYNDLCIGNCGAVGIPGAFFVCRYAQSGIMILLRLLLMIIIMIIIVIIIIIGDA